MEMVTSSTSGAFPRIVEKILLAQELMVVSYRETLSAVFFLDGVIPHPAVCAMLHFWIVLAQISRDWPAGVLTLASGG